jgi:hypothetical protein
MGRSSRPIRIKNIHFSMSSRPALGSTKPPGTGDFFPGVKRPERESDHSPPSPQLVPRSRRSRSIHPLSHTPSWRCAQLAKHRDNFTFIEIVPLGIVEGIWVETEWPSRLDICSIGTSLGVSLLYILFNCVLSYDYDYTRIILRNTGHTHWEQLAYIKNKF